MIDNLDSNKLKESIEAEAIKRLENLSSIPVPQYKLLILAVYLNLKLASEFHTDFLENPEEVSAEIKDILKSLGLFYEVSEANYDQKNPNLISLSFLVSKNQKLLKDKQPKFGEQDYYLKQGQLFGYPLSAIEGFKNKESLNDDNLPIELTDEDKRFMFFALSKNNWREEVKWLREIESAIKTLSPVIYDQIMNYK